ncbi:hypothetical protein ACOMHN_060930 [Nucella lapillus]
MKTRWRLVSTLLLLLLPWMTSSQRAQRDNHRRPNIIFIAADDAGYADFQSNDPLMATPNVRALREDGVFLNQSYVLPMCAPSGGLDDWQVGGREVGVFLNQSYVLPMCAPSGGLDDWQVGRYPHTFGLQDASVNVNMVFWVNETFTFLPRELQRLNYTTHMLGKWHLGFCHPGVTPRGRGFDSFYGFWLGSHDSYYTHTKGGGTVYDWFDNDTVDFSARDKYQTELLNARAVQLVERHHDASRPFFMYLSYGAPHGPFQVPAHYEDTHCSHVTNGTRRTHCAMMAVLDLGVGALVSALKDKGIYDETLILFMSDNGGPVKYGSVNYPLRAGKKNLYEGGIRSYTLLKLPGSRHANTTWSGLAHAIDWFPTLVRAAGGGGQDYLHGYELYSSIVDQQPSPREDFIIVSDFFRFNHTMLRWKQWKLLTSIPGLDAASRWTPGFSSGWYPPYQLLEQGVPWEDVNRKYRAGEYLLYNIEQDPEERQDRYPELMNEAFVEEMKDRLQQYLGVPGVRKGTHPLYPFPYDSPRTSKSSRNGVLVTCWCHPHGLPDCRNSPSRNSTLDPGRSSTLDPGRSSSLDPGRSSSLDPGRSSTLDPGRDTNGGVIAWMDYHLLSVVFPCVVLMFSLTRWEA